MTNARPDVGLRSERGPILLALMVATSLVALDSTIIATASLTIVRQLGGFAQFPWLFSIYLLAQAVTVPIYGKLADTIGRKPLMLWGIGVFALGSILCGLATSMVALIVFRAVQGVGAGAVQPMSMTIAGDIYTLRERAKVQGYIASVWAVSAVAGPALGGVFADYLGWRWIFFTNIPLCAVAAWMIARNFHEEHESTGRRVDFLGAVLLTVGVGAVIFGLLESGHLWPWASLTSLLVFGGGAVFLVLFVLVEVCVEDPILPLWVFTHRVLATSSAVSFLVGALVLGLTSYIPTFVQGVLHAGALVAGFALAPLVLSWPLAASQSGRLYLRAGFRFTAVIGSVVTAIGVLLTTQFSPITHVWQVAAACFVIGCGMGLVAGPTLIAAQSSVEWSERGVVTSTNMFCRSIGSAIGIAVFGALVNSQSGNATRTDTLELVAGLHMVFVAVAAATLAMIIASVLMPRR